MMRLAAAVVVLAGLCSGQLLFSLRQLGQNRPRALFDLTPAAAPPADYKQEVEQRNADCFKQCSSQFGTAEGSVQRCERGCRLFALSEAKDPNLETGEHRSKCAKDCETGYPVLVEQHACQSGCQYQQPKQQAGAPMVVSIMRKFTFDSDDGQEVRRSQSSMLVNDGNGMRVIQGPAMVVVSRHGGDDEPAGLLSPSLDGVMARMRQAVGRMMAHLRGDGQPRLQLGETTETTAGPADDLLDTAEVTSDWSWQRAWRCTPHYVVLAVLMLATALVLYTCYCLACVARRRRRLQQEQLVQNEEVAEDLPPKYAVVIEQGKLRVPAEGDPPPTYAAIAADAELPPKLDV